MDKLTWKMQGVKLTLTIKGLTAKEIPSIGLILHTERHPLDKSSRDGTHSGRPKKGCTLQG